MLKPDDRGSLMNLKTGLPKVTPIQATEEMERRIMGKKSVDEAAFTHHGDVRKDISTAPRFEDRSKASSGPSTRREGTILLNAKIPISLHTRLKRTSQYNDVSMTDILLRGIEAELESGHYSLPPETWGSDER